MKKNNKTAGFTLFEVVAAVAVFLVMLGTVGAVYVSYVKKNRTQLIVQTVQQDIQNFVDILDREVRTGFGSTFKTTGGFTFLNQNLKCVTYSKSSSNQFVRYEYDQQSGASPQDRCGNYVNPVILSSNKTAVRQLNFNVVNSNTGTTPDGKTFLRGPQGLVTVAIEACPKYVSNPPCVYYQTSISSRQLNVPPQ